MKHSIFELSKYCIKCIVWNIYLYNAHKDHCKLRESIAYSDILMHMNSNWGIRDKAIELGKKLFTNDINQSFQSLDDLPEMQDIYDMLKSLTNI